MSINDYQLEKQIGSGTFGDVFRGIEKHSGKKVAIKRLRKKILFENGKYLLKAFYREIDCMKKCECENSIKFIKDFQTQNNYNIIMELCDTDLLCHLYERPKPFSVDEIREIFSQLNNVFRKMNQNNILHRDLKLGNILIKFTDPSKTHFIPKLSDYGFSKELNSYNFSSCTHLGTPATMAPEIMMNYPYNDKSDLWSVGVMMYQLYYREVPYEGNSEQEILDKINSNLPYKQPEDPTFRDLINRLLVVDVQRRLSWNQYFNHPFFTGKELEYEYSNNNGNNNNLYNSISYMPLSHSNSEELMYPHVSHNEEFFVQAGIYSNTEVRSSENLYSFQDNLEKNNDIYFSNVEIMERGKGISDNDCNAIIQSCIEVQNSNIYPMADECIKKIKKRINGEWFVFICTEEEDNYDFFISYVMDDRILVFKYRNNMFQICQIEEKMKYN